MFVLVAKVKCGIEVIYITEEYCTLDLILFAPGVHLSLLPILHSVELLQSL